MPPVYFTLFVLLAIQMVSQCYLCSSSILMYIIHIIKHLETSINVILFKSFIPFIQYMAATHYWRLLCLNSVWSQSMDNSEYTVKVMLYMKHGQEICLICMHKPEGAQHPRASADISGNLDRTCYICYVTLLALQKSAELAIHCTAFLYKDRCCLWLWVFKSNVSMMFIRYIV